MRLKVLVFAISLLAIVLSLLAFFPANKLALTPACEPDGLVSRLKASAQGNRFWNGQSEYLDSEIEWFVTMPERLAKFKAESSRTSKKAEQLMRDIYQQYPPLRPSEQERAASALREQADAIESAEDDAVIEKSRVELIRQLQSCRQIVAARAGAK